jgi:hypothetical protein
VVRERTGRLLDRLRVLQDAIGAAVADTPDAGADGEAADFSALELPALREALVNMDTEAVNARLKGYAALSLNREARDLADAIEQDILLFEYEKAIEKTDRVLKMEVP